MLYEKQKIPKLFVDSFEIWADFSLFNFCDQFSLFLSVVGFSSNQTQPEKRSTVKISNTQKKQQKRFFCNRYFCMASLYSEPVRDDVIYND